MKAAFQKLHHRYEMDRPPAAETGFLNLDDLISRIWPCDLTILTAGSAMYRSRIASHFAIQIGAQAASSGKGKIVFVSETSAELLVTQAISALSLVDQDRFLRGDIQDEEWPRITTAITTLLQLDIDLYGATALHSSEWLMDLRALAKSSKPSLVLIENLQCLHSSDHHLDDATKLRETLKGLKALAVDLRIPVLALGLPPRNPYEEGVFDALVDTLLRLNHELTDTSSSGAPERCEIRVLKTRDNRTGSVPLLFRPLCGRFEEPTATGQ